MYITQLVRNTVSTRTSPPDLLPVHMRVLIDPWKLLCYVNTFERQVRMNGPETDDRPPSNLGHVELLLFGTKKSLCCLPATGGLSASVLREPALQTVSHQVDTPPALYQQN